MGSFISQQPNGLYCRFSTVVDCPTHWNMTREDYLNNVTGTILNPQDDEEILKYFLRPFEEVTENFVPNNMTIDEFNEVIELMHK